MFVCVAATLSTAACDGGSGEIEGAADQGPTSSAGVVSPAGDDATGTPSEQSTAAKIRESQLCVVARKMEENWIAVRRELTVGSDETLEDLLADNTKQRESLERLSKLWAARASMYRELSVLTPASSQKVLIRSADRCDNLARPLESRSIVPVLTEDEQIQFDDTIREVNGSCGTTIE